MRTQPSELIATGLLGVVPVGGQIAGPFASLPIVRGAVFDWADGGLIDRSSYPAFFAAQGGAAHVYNGGVDPGSNQVRKPDKRGRVSVGADNFGQGAAGRVTVANHALGQNGGEERHTLSLAEIPGGLMAQTGSGSFLLSFQQSSAAPVYNVTAAGSGGTHNNLPPFENDRVIVRIA